MIFAVITLCLFITLLLKSGYTLKTSILLTLSLGLSHLFWHLAVITESYILTSFFLILCLLLLEGYRKNPTITKLSAIFFCGGLAIQVNLIFALLFLILLLMHLKYVIPHRIKIFLPLLMFIVALTPIILIIAKEIGGGSTFKQSVLDNFLQQKYKSAISLSALVDFKRIIKICILFLYQCPFLSILTIVTFIYPLKNSPSSLAYTRHLTPLLLLLISTIIYTMPKSVYFLTFATIFYILLIGIKLNSYIENVSTKKYIFLIFLLITIHITLYWITPRLVKNINIGSNIPFRNSAVYFLSPWKHNDHSSYQLFKYCTEKLDENSVLISDFSVLKVFEYYKLIGQKIPFELWDIDKKDILEKVKNYIGKKNIYFTDNSSDYKILHNNFLTKKADILYKIYK